MLHLQWQRGREKDASPRSHNIVNIHQYCYTMQLEVILCNVYYTEESVITIKHVSSHEVLAKILYAVWYQFNFGVKMR